MSPVDATESHENQIQAEHKIDATILGRETFARDLKLLLPLGHFSKIA